MIKVKFTGFWLLLATGMATAVFNSCGENIVNLETNKTPTCTITSPQNNAQFSTGENVTVTVVAEDVDGTIAEVQLYVDNAGHSTKTAFPYNFTVNAGELSAGTHTLRAVAKDDQGAQGESTVNITVNQPNPNSPLPDPAGTITANISANTSINLTEFGGSIGWTGPDNFNLYSGNYASTVSICNLGQMRGLGNMGAVPQAGFTTPQYNISSIACETGYGYVIKFESNTMKPQFVRLYVDETIVSTQGGIMGAKVKYLYAFDSTALSVSADSLIFANVQGTKTVTVTTDAADWTYSNYDSWISIVKNSNTLSVSVEANETLTERRGSITVTANDKQQTVRIRQEAGTIPVTSAPYSIGDLYHVNGVLGVVYKVSNGGRNGMIVSYRDTLTSWSTEHEVTGTTADDGRRNMNIIKQRTLWEFRYPPFKWCDDMNTGGTVNWYLPSIEEMKDLYAGFCGLSAYPGVENDAPTVYKTFRDKFNAPLVRYGGNNIVETDSYWSSSEVEGNANQAWIQNFHLGQQYNFYTKAQYRFRVRCVRSF